MQFTQNLIDSLSISILFTHLLFVFNAYQADFVPTRIR